MKFSADTPRRQVQIASETYSVPEPFNAGHTCTENEAAALNQLLAENVRNNFAGKVKKAQEDNQPAPDQSTLDEYVASYEFGVRTGGGGRTLDPVEKEMRDIAAAKVKEAMKAAGIKLSDVPTKTLNEKVEATVQANEAALRKIAEKNVANRNKFAAELGEITV